jgi:Zn finger protein HypA/HybF involved in hydrogenase expression
MAQVEENILLPVFVFTRVQVRSQSTAETLTVHCKQCSTEWTLPITRPMEIDKAIAVMRQGVKSGCPVCGANGANVLAGPKVQRVDMVRAQ